ncbi:hypothetical protein OXX59_001757 [Metschnikowia pulcherrima]
MNAHTTPEHSDNEGSLNSTETSPSQPDRAGLDSVRRGPWSPEEDRKLMDIIALYGPSNWVRISLSIKTRSPKQCRERYHQNLKPSLNRNPITYQEGVLIEQLVGRYGKKWAEISRHLPGRSDNAIKNWWNGGANRRRRASQVSLPIMRNLHPRPARHGESQPHMPTHRSDPQIGSAGPVNLASKEANMTYMVPVGPQFPAPLPPFHGAPLQPVFPPPHPFPHSELPTPNMRYAYSPRFPVAGTDTTSAPRLPSLAPVAFNTAIFDAGARVNVPSPSAATGPQPHNSAASEMSYPPLSKQRLSDPPAWGPSTSPALYTTAAPGYAFYSSCGSAGSSGSTSSAGTSISGYYDYTGQRPPAMSLSSTSSSQTSRRPSTAIEHTMSARSSAGSLAEEQSRRDHVSSALNEKGGRDNEPFSSQSSFMHGRPYQAAEPQSSHFVVPPFKSLVRSITTPEPNPGQNESISVSRLIN